MNRRDFLRRLIVSSVLVAVSIAGIDELLLLARTNQGSRTQSQLTTSAISSLSSVSAPAGYVFITQLSALNGLSYAYFSHPSFGNSIFVSVSGQWKAFSATCTHQICTVQYPGSTIYCPCHGGTFDPSNGNVTGGPPPAPLPEFGVQILSGNVFVSLNRIN